MDKEINSSGENKINFNEKNNQEYIIKNDLKNKKKDKNSSNSSVTEIKNMFDINENNNSSESNTFHNSVKMFPKRNLNTNSETSLPRTKSNKHIKEEQNSLNNKNFPSKANFCKGNINNLNKFGPPKSSPIVQYFQVFDTRGQGSLENRNSLGFLASPASSIFNCSPSLIFNNTKKIRADMLNFRKSVDTFNLNNPIQDKNATENSEYDLSKFDVSYNEENETSNKNDSDKIMNENDNKQTDNKFNKIENEEKNKENNIETIIDINGNDKNERNEIINNKISPIQNALKQLKRRKSKFAENNSDDGEEKKDIKNEIENNQEEINQKSKEKKNFENDETLVKNVLDNLDEGFLLDEKNKKFQNTEKNERFDEIKDQKDNLSSLNSFIYKGLNQNDNLIKKQINNNIQPNQYNNFRNNNYNQNMLNYMNQGIKNNPNLINNNYINNSMNNNYNNAYIQFNYMMNNNLNPNPNINLMMMNNKLNAINNNKYIPYNKILNSNNNALNALNSNYYNLSQGINNNNIAPFNTNNFELQKYNQILQNSGNINIQNNYFLYNNNQENNNNNNKNIKEEKQKKKKKKKVKKLEQNAYMNKPINYYLENFTIIAKDQGASRYLQDLLNNYPPEIINTFFEPLCKNILQLINDPFANYLIQKIICFFTQQQLLKLLQILSPSFEEISCDCHGTRVLQKLIELIKIPESRNLFYELVKPRVCKLLKDLNGTYIVQKFAGMNMLQYGLKINKIIIENSIELCTYRHGCCVIQKYLETRDVYMLPELVYKLLDGFSSLITDQFGNYVIKTILLIGNPEFSNKIGENIYNNILYYSKHKYSSNVVEKCFEYCQGMSLNKLIFSVQQEQNLKELILDEHGNYVVQKVLSISNTKKKKEMLSIIKSLFPELKKSHFGERIIHRITSTYPIIYNL